MAEWLDKFMAQHEKKVGEHTRLALARSQVLVEERFSREALLKSITAENALGFREWLIDDRGMAQPTVAKVIKHAKQFFNVAVCGGILDRSPSAEVTAGTQANEERSVYVSTEGIQRAIAMAPDAQWRLLIVIALYPYAGAKVL